MARSPTPPPQLRRVGGYRHRVPPHPDAQASAPGPSPSANAGHYTQDPKPLDPTSITTPAKLPDDLVGELLHGRYQVTKLIASGGQACVYKAEDTLHRMDVAIKVFRGKDPEAVDHACEQNRWAASRRAPTRPKS